LTENKIGSSGELSSKKEIADKANEKAIAKQVGHILL
jgi:hypothetical protein